MVVEDDGRVAWVGAAADAPAADEVLDVDGRAVLPAFVDCHTHLVFAGDRAAEFEARMTGTPYDGGGIATTVAATAAATDDELRTLLAGRVAETRAQGTGTLEVSRATASTSTPRRGCCGWPPRSPTRSRSSARTSCRPPTPGAARSTSPW